MRELSAQLTEGEKSLIHFDLPSGNSFLESLRLFGDKSPKIHLPLGKGGYPPGYFLGRQQATALHCGTVRTVPYSGVLVPLIEEANAAAERGL